MSARHLAGCDTRGGNWICAAGCPVAAHRTEKETTMPEPERVPVDFGDLLIAVAEDLDHIRQCVGCGEDSTWAGLFVGDDGLVSVSAWCDAASCEHDRTVMSAGRVLALPINHLPRLRTRTGA